MRRREVATVSVLGTVQIGETDRGRLRRKAFDLAGALGADRDVAARIAAEVSDVVRYVEAHARRAHMTVSVDERAQLAFTFAWDELRVANGELPSVLRHYALRHGDDRVTLAYRLREGGVDVAELERARSVLVARSREELFASLEASNEALRRSTEEAKQAGEAKARFLANMSHEIRTPLNVIVGMNRLALGTELTPRQRGYLEKIDASTRHLLGIIDDILDVSKLDAGKLTLERGELSVCHVLDDIASLAGTASAEKGLLLRLDVADGIPDPVRGDALRLRQVLLNLVTNAVKFTERGEIVVHVERQSDEEGEVVLRFAVRDTGIGLTDEQLEGLFTSFSQADTTITRRYGGTGLGLAISKSLVELMGGEIGAESRAGEGSTFWFTARFGAADARAEARVLRSDLHGRRALVVDDDAEARQALRRLLERMGLRVDEVGSGHAALRVVASDDAGFDLVFIDRRMPDLDGLQTAARLGSLPPEQRPGIFLTTDYGADEVRGSDAESVDQVLMKPVDASVLFESVAAWYGAATGRSGAGTGGAVAGEGPGDGAPVFDPSARILLVEDNRLNQEVAIELLAEVGLTPTVVGDGAQALEALRRDAFDLVLMDVQMPVLDGLSATRAIRADGALRHLPVVAMTANALPSDHDAYREAGMDDVVTKPIDPEELWRALAANLPVRGQQSETADDRPPAAALPHDVPGLDVARGLRFARGREPLYLELLEGFLDDQRDLPRLVRESLDGGDVVTAERLAHTVRGLASLLGAGPLADAGEVLEGALRAKREDEVVLAAADALEAVHRELFTALDAHFGRPAATSSR
jgi:two-component system, sensor histidine kinase and response regulator